MDPLPDPISDNKFQFVTKEDFVAKQEKYASENMRVFFGWIVAQPNRTHKIHRLLKS